MAVIAHELAKTIPARTFYIGLDMDGQTAQVNEPRLVHPAWLPTLFTAVDVGFVIGTFLASALRLRLVTRTQLARWVAVPLGALVGLAPVVIANLSSHRFPAEVPVSGSGASERPDLYTMHPGWFPQLSYGLALGTGAGLIIALVAHLRWRTQARRGFGLPAGSVFGGI